MTRDPADPPRDEDAALVGEYVLRLLSPDEAGGLEARMAREPHLGALHAEWEERLAPLLGAQDVAPPASLRARVERRIFDRERTARRGGFGLLWGALSGAVAAAALVAALSLAVPLSSTFAPTLLADLQAAEPGGAVTASVEADPETGELRLAVAGPSPDADRVFQAWTIDGDAAPRSLGLIGPGGTLVVEAGSVALRDGLIVAISDEPVGGAPAGSGPTGPVLALGPLAAL